MLRIFLCFLMVLGSMQAAMPPIVETPEPMPPSKPRVAVVGGGAAGLTTAWLLDQECMVTLYEKESRLGGHANTLTVEAEGQIFHLDGGFEFFTKEMHPTFTALLGILGVPVHQFPLYYTFYHTNGSHVLTLPPILDDRIAWNVLSPSNLIDELQFKYLLSEAETLVNNRDVGISVKQFADGLCVSGNFKDQFLYPFLAGCWGFSLDALEDFAAYNPLKYVIKNIPSGLTPNQWNEVVGGTMTYVNTMASQLQNTQVKLSSHIARISYKKGVYTIIEEDGKEAQFDHLVLATNAAQAKELLCNIPEASDISLILGKIKYHLSTMAIHGDRRLMPPEKSDWAVVNIRYDGKTIAATSFYKPWLTGSVDIFRSNITYDLQAGNGFPEPLYALAQYWHPQVDVDYFHVQEAVQTVNGNRNLWFAGIYTYDEDSHESAICSAIEVAKRLAPSSIRLNQLLQQ